MKFPIASCLVLLGCLTIVVEADEDQYLRVMIGRRLANHVQVTLYSMKELHCLYECTTRSNKCGSVNYHSEKKICEINNVADGDDKGSNGNGILPNADGWKYFEKAKKKALSFKGESSFSHEKLIKVQYDTHIGNLMHQYQTWTLNFTIKPHSKHRERSNILSFHSANDTNQLETLSIDFASDSTNLSACVLPSRTGKKDCLHTSVIIPVGYNTEVFVHHGFNIIDKKYFTAISYNKSGSFVGSMSHNKSLKYNNIRVFVSSPNALAANASVQKVNFKSILDGRNYEKYNIGDSFLHGFIPRQGKQWKLSFKFILTKAFFPRFKCLFNLASSRKNVCGQRQPFLMLEKKSRMMHTRICAGRNFNTPLGTRYQLSKNKEYALVIQQVMDPSDGDKFYVSLKLNGTMVRRIENKAPVEFQNLALYSGIVGEVGGESCGKMWNVKYENL